jgi:small GTP-binding protein
MNNRPKEEETDNDPNYSNETVSHKLVILGDVAVGKSSIAQRYSSIILKKICKWEICCLTWADHRYSLFIYIGALFLTKKIAVNGCQVKFEIWDTAGQERYHALTPMYYRNANAAVIVFDVANKTSFERAQKWNSELIEKGRPGIVIALCGNKIDLDERQVSHEVKNIIN